MNPHLNNLAAIYNDLIATAGATIVRMKDDSFLDERFAAQIIGQLNGTLYALAFGLPPGTMKVENVDTLVISEVRTCESVESKAQ